jgi:thioredoxin-like negative regulator of GroEL
MQEQTEAEWLARLAAGERTAVFLYTPLCGTCKAAGRMLDVIANLPSGIEVERLNINFAPRLAQMYKVESVPCLLMIEDGQPPRKLYAFESVQHVYRFLAPFIRQLREKRH